MFVGLEKESETNAKIVDLFKEALDEIKNCRTEQQRVEFHIALDCVMSPRDDTIVFGPPKWSLQSPTTSPE